jgi:hypothetical protein
MQAWARLALAGVMVLGQVGAASAQSGSNDAPLPQVLGPPAVPAGPAPAPPPAAPKPATPIKGECVAYVVTDLGPKTMTCPLQKALPEGAACGCSWGPVPDGELPSPPAAGHVQGAG